MPIKLRCILLVAISACLFSSVSAQEKKMAVITGILKDARTKSPLNEAVITLSSSAFKGQKFALTDSTGMYRIGNLSAGTYTISFEMEGYEKYTHENITLPEGMSLGVSFEMVKEGRKKNSRKLPVSGNG